MSDQKERLEALLDDLEHGRIGTADAAKALRGMSFPALPRRTAHQIREDSSLPELDVPEEDSFFPVSQAYAAGRITRRQYEALAAAAAASTA